MSDMEEPGPDTAAHLANTIPVSTRLWGKGHTTPQLGTTSGAAGGPKGKEILGFLQEQFCRGFLLVEHIPQGLFLPLVAAWTGQSPKRNMESALRDLTDEERRQTSRTNSARCHRAPEQMM